MLPSDKHHAGLADNLGDELGLLPDCVGSVRREVQTGGEWNNRLKGTLARFGDPSCFLATLATCFATRLWG